MDNRYNNEEEHTYMFVKKLHRIPFYEDTEFEAVLTPDDNYTYFQIISNHFLHGLVFRMKNEEFHKRFTNVRAGSDPNPDMHVADKGAIYNSREWLFYDKVIWWNKNIDEVCGCCGRDEIEYVDIYNTICDEYCRKFKVNMGDFIEDKKFFDDMLTEIHIDKRGKIHTYKKRKSKPRKFLQCYCCGRILSSKEDFISLEGNKVICIPCNEESYKDVNYYD